MAQDIGTYQDAVTTPPTIAGGVILVATSGYAAEGDGGGAFFIATGAEPANAPKFQAADARWFGIAPWQVHLAEMFGAVGDGVMDDAPAINAALANPAVTILCLLAKTYAVGASIALPAFKTITGEGIGSTILLALDGIQDTGTNISIILAQDAEDVRVGNLTVDVNKVGLNQGSTKRTNGVTLFRTTGFLVENVRVANATAYGLWSNGGNDVVNTPSSGTFVHCYADNCQICFEQGASDGVLLLDCHARAAGGGGDVPCFSFFHPLIGSRNITYRDCSGIGAANAGIDPQADGTVDLGRIVIENVRVELSSGGVGLSCAPGQPNRIELIQISNSAFRVENGIGAQFRDVEVRASQSEFYGASGVVGFAIGGEFANCTIIGRSESVGAKGMIVNSILSASEKLRVRGGTVTADGPDLGPAYAIAIAGDALVDVGGSAILSPPQAPSRTIIGVTARTNTTVTSRGNGYYRIEKTGGSNNVYDADAVSASALAGDFVVEIIAPAFAAFAAGLSTNPTASAGASNLNCGYSLAPDGQLYRAESGAYSVISVYEVGQSLWLRRRGAYIEYIRGGATPDHGEVVRVVKLAAAVYFDCSIYDLGTKFDVRVWQ